MKYEAYYLDGEVMEARHKTFESDTIDSLELLREGMSCMQLHIEIGMEDSWREYHQLGLFVEPSIIMYCSVDNPQADESRCIIAIKKLEK